MPERCNCDASCGENRYHDAGDPGCRFSGDEEYLAYWDARQPKWMKSKEANMAKASIKTKLTQVNENFSINMYDNGYMIEVSGKDKKDDYKTSKIMVNSVEELVELVKEVTSMDRTD